MRKTKSIITMAVIIFLAVVVTKFTPGLASVLENTYTGAGSALSSITQAINEVTGGGLGLSNTVTQPPVDVPAVEGQAQVHYIDVGQADCELIIDGNSAMLIDCGNYDDRDTVLNYLSAYGITHLDYAVFTHPHEDHIGCAAAVIKKIDIGTVILSSSTNTTACYTSMMDAISSTGTNSVIAQIGDTYSFGNGKFQILGPVPSVDWSGELNNSSVVLKYYFGNTSFLFQGDAEREEEQGILDCGYDVSCDVYKVGHHGSDSSTSYPWLRAMMPKIAVIEVGEGNDYGHPTDGVLSKLNDAGVQTFRTDLNGTVVVTTDGSDVWATTQK